LAYVNSIFRHIQRAIPVYPLWSLPTILSFFLSGSPLSLQMQMGPKHLQTTLTRTKLEQLTLHIAEKIREPLMKVLADTNLEPKDMDKIWLNSAHLHLKQNSLRFMAYLI
jgi:Hsp70 protein